MKPVTLKQFIKKAAELLAEHGNIPIRVSDDWSDEFDRVENGLDISEIRVERVRSDVQSGHIVVVMIRTI